VFFVWKRELCCRVTLGDTFKRDIKERFKDPMGIERISKNEIKGVTPNEIEISACLPSVGGYFWSLRMNI